MTKLPIINCKKLDKILICLEFKATRQRGSHVFYRHSDGRTTTVPHHQGFDLARPLLRSILQDIELSPDQFLEIFNK